MYGAATSPALITSFTCDLASLIVLLKSSIALLRSRTALLQAVMVLVKVTIWLSRENQVAGLDVVALLDLEVYMGQLG